MTDPGTVTALLAPPAGLDRWPVVVIGGGAAGLLAAIHSADAGVPTLVLESAARPGAKIRVSGGGRCNVLPSTSVPSDLHTEGSPHALGKLLRSWPLPEVTAFFADRLGIPLKVEATGKVFPRSDDARDVVRALLAETARAGAVLVTGVRVSSVVSGSDEVTVAWAQTKAQAEGADLAADRVVVTTGGLSLPRTGSDGAGYSFARAAGHQIVPTYPALVPLVAADRGWEGLAGVAVPARITARRGRVVWEGCGDLLFTHTGLSGPVALDASHQLTAPWGRSTTLGLGFGPVDGDLEAAAAWWRHRLTEKGTRSIGRVVAEAMPAKLADRLVAMARVDRATTLAELRRDDREALIGVLTDCPYAVAGDGGYRVAEVTGGGVPLGDLDTRTLASRRDPRLHFAGEVVDVTGRLGGHNFLWAWVSGRLAGRGAATAAGTAGGSSG